MLCVMAAVTVSETNAPSAAGLFTYDITLEPVRKSRSPTRPRSPTITPDKYSALAAWRSRQSSPPPADGLTIRERVALASSTTISSLSSSRPVLSSSPPRSGRLGRETSPPVRSKSPASRSPTAILRSSLVTTVAAPSPVQMGSSHTSLDEVRARMRASRSVSPYRSVVVDDIQRTTNIIRDHALYMDRLENSSLRARATEAIAARREEREREALKEKKEFASMTSTYATGSGSSLISYGGSSGTNISSLAYTNGTGTPSKVRWSSTTEEVSSGKKSPKKIRQISSRWGYYLSIVAGMVCVAQMVLSMALWWSGVSGAKLTLVWVVVNTAAPSAPSAATPKGSPQQAAGATALQATHTVKTVSPSLEGAVAVHACIVAVLGLLSLLSSKTPLLRDLFTRSSGALADREAAGVWDVIFWATSACTHAILLAILLSPVECYAVALITIALTASMARVCTHACTAQCRRTCITALAFLCVCASYVMVQATATGVRRKLTVGGLALIDIGMMALTRAFGRKEWLHALYLGALAAIIPFVYWDVKVKPFFQPLV
jgi:hypothetical protein